MIPKTHECLISLPFSVSINYKGCMLKGGKRVCVMHPIKGGWARQTFALAKSHESGETKSRIRPSKKERKEMVESFIKKYQNLNNGTFPSLSLTQKEVGGSFYTIREIFREIIQENRVLGPAKLLLEEQNADQLLEKFPSCTISTEPETSQSLSPNGSPLVYDRQQDTIEEEEEVYLISDGIYAKPEPQRFDNGQVINRSHLIVTSKECDDIKVVKAQVSEAMETEKNEEEVVALRTKVTQMLDVIVETFPLQPVSQPTDNLDGNTSDVITQPIDSNVTLVDENVENALLGPGYVTSKSDVMNLSRNSCLVDEKEEENLAAGLLLEGDSNLVSEKALKTVTDLPLGSSNSSGIKGVVHDAQVEIDVAVKSSHNDDKAIGETKVVNASNGRLTKTLNGTNGSTNSRETIIQEVTGNKTNIEPNGSSQKGNNPTVERINLKSWEGDSKKHAESETNPVLATFKSLVDAFVKFWS